MSTYLYNGYTYSKASYTITHTPKRTTTAVRTYSSCAVTQSTNSLDWIPRQPKWNFWWIKCKWEMFLSKNFSFLLSVISPLLYAHLSSPPVTTITGPYMWPYISLAYIYVCIYKQIHVGIYACVNNVTYLYNSTYTYLYIVFTHNSFIMFSYITHLLCYNENWIYPSEWDQNKHVTHDKTGILTTVNCCAVMVRIIWA